MKFTSKDLDALLYDWVQQVLKDEDSGYPSNYTLSQRVDQGAVHVPDYFPHPRISRISSIINDMDAEMRGAIIGRYVLNESMENIAKVLKCHIATVYRKFEQARVILLDEMRKFVYKEGRV